MIIKVYTRIIKYISFQIQKVANLRAALKQLEREHTTRVKNNECNAI